MKERKKFIEACQVEQDSFTTICRRFGISPKTGYKWLRRYNEQGDEGLMDQRRVAVASPHRSDDEVVAAILGARKEHATWGPKKLRALLVKAQPTVRWPAVSTIGDVLKRFGMIRPRRRRVRATPSPGPLSAGLLPNDLWCVDFKGHFGLGDGTRCYPLTVTDQCSRYVLKCEAVSEPRTKPVQTEFERAFREFGMPLRIRSDNGPPFASTGAGGLSALSVWWMKLGVEPERITPASPQENGRHERMHRTLKAEATQPAAQTRSGQQLVFDAWRREFNELRPHEALGQRPPATVYEPSRRVFPAELLVPQYGDDSKVRWVAQNGLFNWRGGLVSVGACLGGEPVGVRQVTQTAWEVRYSSVLLGTLDDRDDTPRLRRVVSATVSASHGEGDACAFPVDSRCAPDHREAPSPPEAVDEFFEFWREEINPIDE